MGGQLHVPATLTPENRPIVVNNYGVINKCLHRLKKKEGL